MVIHYVIDAYYCLSIVIEKDDHNINFKYVMSMHTKYTNSQYVRPQLSFSTVSQNWQGVDYSWLGAVEKSKDLTGCEHVWLETGTSDCARSHLTGLGAVIFNWMRSYLTGRGHIWLGAGSGGTVHRMVHLPRRPLMKSRAAMTFLPASQIIIRPVKC